MAPLDPTGLERQKRHLARPKKRGIIRKTVCVHRECAPYLDKIKKHFLVAENATILKSFSDKLEKEKPINVSQVNKLSPFRYPGGKTWLVPKIKEILLNLERIPAFFIEPFAGGAIIGLTVAAERLADMVILVELDDGVAAVWETILNEPEPLCQEILGFQMNHESAIKVLEEEENGTLQMAFQTIIRNRVQHGGILAPGASLIKMGENGKGILSRWYPRTIVKRIRKISLIKDRVTFIHGDGFGVIKKYQNEKSAFFFVDPPYTAGGKKAGKRLYTHNQIDHEYLFQDKRQIRDNL
jgi:DNA adenine methylase